jgi:UDP-glucose 4-epimerase
MRDVITVAEQITGRAIPIAHNPPVAENRVMIADTIRISRDLSWAPQRSSLSTIIGHAWDVMTRQPCQ